MADARHAPDEEPGRGIGRPEPAPDKPAGQDTDERRGDGRHRAENALGIVYAPNAPDVRAEDRAVDPRGQIAFLPEVARADARHGHELERRPVPEDGGRGEHGLRPPAADQEDERGREIAHRDALQHAGDTDRGEVEVGTACSTRPSAKMIAERRRIRSARSPREAPSSSRRPRLERDRRTPTMKRKKGKTRSVGVHPCQSACRERAVDVAPAPGVVDEHHRGHGEPAEHVEREDPPAGHPQSLAPSSIATRKRKIGYHAGHEPDTNGPLSPYSVLDLTRARSGPTCVRQLADLGASVIQVAAREGEDGDFSRRGFDAQNLHRNKRSITLNLKSPEGIAILKKLAAKSDILVENFRPDVKTRLGIDYESLSAAQSRG